MKKILSTLVMCLILGVGSVWAELIDVTLSAPNNTSNPLITQTMGDLGGEKKLSEAWQGGEPGNSQTALMLNKQVGAGSNEARITFASPDHTIIHKYSFNVWFDWISKKIGRREVNTNFKPEYKVNSGNYVTPGTTNNTNSVSMRSYSSRELTFTTNRKGISYQGAIVKFDAEYRVFSNNWTFGITIPEVIEPTDNPTTTLNKITASDLLAGKRTRTATLTFTVKDPIGTTSTTIKDYFEASIIASNGSSWSLGADWTVEQLSPRTYTVKIPVTFTATTDDPGDFDATVQLKPKHTVEYNGTDYSVGRKQIVKVAVNQQGTYAIDWKPKGWVNGGTITIFKGDFYERNDYLKNTDGLDLAIPNSSNSSVVSVDSRTGKITATEVGSTVLTYVQKGNDDYEAKTLTLNVDVIKRTPVFTLNSKSTYTENGNIYHVFYPNKSYPNFVTTTNGDLGNYPVTITPEGDMTNIISFNGVSAEVESALIDGIKITIFQQSGDLWDEKSQDFYISIRNNPMHVGTLCERTLEELFNDNYGYNEAKYENSSIVLGSNSKNTNGGYIIFRFEGTPDKLECSYETTKDQDNSATWSLTQSIDGISFYPLGEANAFDAEARYVKVAISGSYKDWTQTTYGVMGKITRLCITERVGASIIPKPIEMIKKGDQVDDATLTANISNLTAAKFVIAGTNSEDFQLVLPNKTFDTNTNTIHLDYQEGLGVDRYVEVPITIIYVGGSASATSKTCEIIAKDEADNELDRATVTIKEIEMVDGVSKWIYDANSEHTGIWTGTEGTSTTFPYKPKVEVNVSSAFSATGIPLFDYLYIFGLTTDQSGGNNINAANPFNPNLTCNAKTPLYMYVKDGAGYRLDPENVFDAVSKRFDHGTSMNGKKLYITGYCPFAYIGGTSATEEGWMYFQGGDTQVDIYLDNCQIMGRNRSSDGSRNYAKYPVNDVVINVTRITGENKNYMQGFSSIFVFNSTSANRGNPYKPTIHIRGNNHLKGHLGYITQVKAALFGSEVNLDMLNSYKNIPTCNSPITIKPDANEGFTNLTLDDIWPVDTYTKEITNGYLQLDSYGYDKLPEGKMPTRAPSIDLGSEFGKLTINGGQYHVHNSTSPDGQYTSNMTFGHRKFLKEATVASITAVLSLYGFGGDMTTNTVIINSGTFTMFKNLIKGGNYYLDQEKYLDLRLPIGTEGNYSRINGGTFNNISNVVFCSQVTSSGQSPVNDYGEWLVLKDVETNGTTSYGSATFEIPDLFKIYDEPQVTYNLVGDLDKVAKGSHLYGGQSANEYTKDGETQIVSLLLSGPQCEGPSGCTQIKEALYVNWITTLPKLGLTISGVEASIGGEKEVPINVALTEKLTMDYVVNQLMYMDLDGMQTYPVNNGDLKVTYEEPSKPYGGITNAEPYKIYKNLNILKTVEADRWYAFTAPFDIETVSVLETEEASVSVLKNRSDAMKKQAEVNAKFLLDTYVMFYPFSDLRSSPYTFNEIASNNGRSLIPLNHYNGTNAADGNHGTNLFNAHYYLYELKEEVFKTAGTGDALEIEWQAVSRDPGEPLMYAGKTYALQFPYCPMCNDLATRDYNDYWTNKIIHFYGNAKPDGTEIQGANFHSEILNIKPAVNNATLAGNSTFAKMTLPANKGYVHNTSTDFFEENKSDVTIQPTQGYMVYGGGAKGMPERISRSGKMIFGDNTTTDLEGVPTIGDRTSILLYDAMEGFEVLSLCEQLVMVYNLQGNLIFRQQMAEGEQVHVAAAEGLYVVKGEREAIKVMVE